MSKRELSFVRKHGEVAGRHIFRLLMLNMRNHRWKVRS